MQVPWSFLVNEAKQRRKKRGLTQKQLADLVGISTPTISNFENGKKSLTFKFALKIFEFLGMTEKKPIHLKCKYNLSEGKWQCMSK